MAVVVTATLGVGFEQVIDNEFEANVTTGIPESAITSTVACDNALLVLHPLIVFVTTTVYISVADTKIGVPDNGEVLGVVHVYIVFGSVLLVAESVAFGAAQVVVTDEAEPSVNVGEVVFEPTVVVKLPVHPFMLSVIVTT